MNPFGQRRCFRLRMKPCLIPDDHMFGLRIVHRNPLEKTATEIQADRREKPELARPFDHLHCGINIFPLAALFLSQHHPLPAQGPAAAAGRMQPKPGLIGHPNLYRPILGQIQFFKVFLQPVAEGGDGGRVLFDVAGTRNPERAPHFSQPVIERLGRPLGGCRACLSVKRLPVPPCATALPGAQLGTGLEPWRRLSDWTCRGGASWANN